jgi:hypothetical protein
MYVRADELAGTWNGHDSDAFGEVLDELERTHRARFAASDREELYARALRHDVDEDDF